MFLAARNPAARLVAAALALLLACGALADDVQDRRTSSGVKFFRALLLADTDLTKKTAAPNQLLIVFYYVDDQRRANELAKAFVQQSAELRGVTVATDVTNDPTLAKLGGRAPAGIFITEAPTRPSIASIVRYGISHHVIVYSPFEGHVELGVLGGLSVEAQVRPFLNHATLEASQISLKPLFLSVAKVFQ